MSLFGIPLTLGNIVKGLPLIGGLFGGGGSSGGGLSREQQEALAQGSALGMGVLTAPLGGGYISPSYQQALYGLAAQMANQRGGMATLPGVPDNQVYDVLQGAGRLLGPAGGAILNRLVPRLRWTKVNGKWQKVATGVAQPTTMTAYTAALQGMLTGQSPFYQSQLAQGVGAINTQAALGRQALMSQLGRRGLLQSGIMTQGLGGLESARLQALSGLIGNLEQQRMQAQQFGMGQVAAQQELIMMARRAGISEAQIEEARRQNDWQRLANMAKYAYLAFSPDQGTPTGIPSSQVPYTLPPI